MVFRFRLTSMERTLIVRSET